MPDSRWEAFPVGARIRVFLGGPMRDYFLGQSLVLRGECWPHGEWSHGAKGVWEYYEDLFETTDRPQIKRYLLALGYPNRRGRVECPCGSRRRLHKVLQAAGRRTEVEDFSSNC